MLTRASSKFFIGCVGVLLSGAASAYEIASHDPRAPVPLAGEHVFSRSIGVLPYEFGSIYDRPTPPISGKGRRSISEITPTVFVENKNRPELVAAAMNVTTDLSRSSSGYRNRRSDATVLDREKQREAKVTTSDGSGSGTGICAMLLLGFTFGCHQIRRKARVGGVRFAPH